MIESGKLRHRITIQSYDYLRDSNGEVIQDGVTGETSRAWVDYATVWCVIEPLSAREFIQSQATQVQISTRIVMRHRADLSEDMRFVHTYNGVDTIYNPHGFLADKESGLEYMTVPCSKWTGQRP